MAKVVRALDRDGVTDIGELAQQHIRYSGYVVTHSADHYVKYKPGTFHSKQRLMYQNVNILLLFLI